MNSTKIIKMYTKIKERGNLPGNPVDPWPSVVGPCHPRSQLSDMATLGQGAHV